MALLSVSSLAPLRNPRRSLISRLPIIFFRRAEFSHSTSICRTPTEDRNGFATRVAHIQAGNGPSPEERNSIAPRIFIKGLSCSTTEGYLVKLFSQFGDISKAKILTSRGAKESLGMAYIWFASEESAHLAVKEMNGKFVDGRFIAAMMAWPDIPTKHVKFKPYKF